MKNFFRFMSVTVAIAMFSETAMAGGAPVALVEEVSARSLKVQELDYLFEGDVLVLAAGETIKVSYLESCTIEKIRGGEAKITIGASKSTVRGKGKLKRKFVECGGAQIAMTNRQSDRAAGVVVRGGKDKGADQAAVTVYSLQPVFKFRNKVATLSLARTNGGDTQTINVGASKLDLASQGVRLSAGGVYRARAGNSEIIFKVARTARATTRNLIGRLIEF